MTLLNLGEMKEFTGEFKSLKDGTIVPVELTLFPGSQKFLADVLQRKQVTRDNQHLLIDQLIIRETGKAVIEEGQYSVLKSGTSYIMTDAPRHPTNFMAKLMTLVPPKSDPTTHYACEVILGNIQLDLSGCSAQPLNDGYIIYEKVPMMLYPSQKYSAKAIE